MQSGSVDKAAPKGLGATYGHLFVRKALSQAELQDHKASGEIRTHPLALAPPDATATSHSPKADNEICSQSVSAGETRIKRLEASHASHCTISARSLYPLGFYAPKLFHTY